KPVEDNLPKWDTFEISCRLSGFCIQTRKVASNIGTNFPDHSSFEPLLDIIGLFLDSPGQVDIVELIKAIHVKVRQRCKLKPMSKVFTFTDESSTDMPKEEIKVQVITNRSRNFRNNRNKIFRDKKEPKV
ncbi:hypothetical protein CANINC_000567, partial [Pichia inconspicua]